MYARDNSATAVTRRSLTETGRNSSPGLDRVPQPQNHRDAIGDLAGACSASSQISHEACGLAGSGSQVRFGRFFAADGRFELVPEVFGGGSITTHGGNKRSGL